MLMEETGRTGLFAFFARRWQRQVPLGTLFWRDVIVVGTLINIGVATTEDPQLTYGGVGIVTRDPVDAAINDGAQRAASIVTNRVVDRSLAIPPTIRIEAGQRIEDFTTVRLFGSYAIARDLRLKLRVENALDEAYEEVLGYPSLPLGVYGQVEWHF